MNRLRALVNPQALAGVVGGVVLFRFAIMPALPRDLVPGSPEQLELAKQRRLAVQGAASPSPLATAAASSTGAASHAHGPLLLTLTNNDDLRELLAARSVVLLARGHSPASVAAARAAFEVAASSLHAADPSAAAALRWWVIDDASAQVPAVAVAERVGVRLGAPFVALVDPSGDRWLQPGTATAARAGAAVPPLDGAAVAVWLRDVSHGALPPALVGLPRPPRDAAPGCPSLMEVVSDSLDELVLGPRARRTPVLLVAYTPRCPACKAFAPRVRMLANLARTALPPGALVVAQVDTLNNDLPRAAFPERWTPALRFFPAAPGGSGDSGGEPRRSILLQAASAVGEGDAAAGGSGGSAVDASAAVATAPAASAAAAPAPTRIYLPTVPAMLEFIAQHAASLGSDGAALAVTPALLARAEVLEAEAAELEAAYDAALGYAGLWKAFDEIAQGAGDGERGERVRADADALRALVQRAHAFLVEEAAEGSIDRALDRLDAVAAFVEAKGVTRAVEQAAAEGKIDEPEVVATMPPLK